MKIPLKAFFLFTLALIMSGATPDSKPWGEYLDPLEVRLGTDGRTMTLLADARYRGPSSRLWSVSKGDVIDGASIPRAFWSIMGGPFEGKYRDASIFHDVECVRKNQPWQDVHEMFYLAMRCSGVSETKAKLMYWAVYRFGPRWEVSVRMKEPPMLKLLDKEFGDREKYSYKIKSTEIEREWTLVTNLTQTVQSVSEVDVKAMQAWIEKSNPSLEEIRSRQLTNSPSRQ